MSNGENLPATSGRIRAAAIGILITVILGLPWAWWGGLAIGGGAALLLVVASIAIASPLLAVAFRLWRMARRIPSGASPSPFRTLSYRVALLFEAIGVPVADILLGREHLAAFMAPVTAMIVGIHFFGLSPALKTRLYLGIGLAMCALAALTMLVLPPTETVSSALTSHHIVIWTAIVGLGSAAILWARAIGRLRDAFEWVRQASVTV